MHVSGESFANDVWTRGYDNKARISKSEITTWRAVQQHGAVSGQTYTSIQDVGKLQKQKCLPYRGRRRLS